MFRTILLATTVALAAPAAAQTTCDAPVGPIETCMVGAWIGSSDGPELMAQFLESLPGTIAASINDFGQPMGLIIYEDGFFETLPTGATLWALVESGEDVTEFDGNLQTTTAAGFLSAVGGTLEMCHMPGTGLAFGQMTGTSSDGTSATVPIGSPPGASGALPPMTYTCAGDTMQMFVHIGVPVPMFTYSMTKVPLSRFPEEFRRQLEERFAPAE